MPIPPVLSHSDHTYLTLTLKPHTSLYTSPELLTTTPLSLSPPATSPSPIHLTYISQIGELADSHIYQVDRPIKSEFERVKDQVLAVLREQEGVVGVKVLGGVKMRAKRGGEL